MTQANPTLDDVWRLFQETDRKFRETDRRFQETERLMKESADETNRQIKQLSKNLGGIGNRLGEFVEHMVLPTVVQLFQARGIEVHEVHSDVSAQRDGQGIQVDLLAVNADVLIAVECKSKMTHDYVDQHVERMGKLNRMLPAYRHHQASGAVAAMVMPTDVVHYAQNQGFYVLMQSGESLIIRNDPSFSATAW